MAGVFYINSRTCNHNVHFGRTYNRSRSLPLKGDSEWEEPEEWERERPYLPDLTVYPDDEPIDTGLVDKHGRKIMRSERAPIGFLNFD